MFKALWVSEELHAHVTREQAKFMIERGGLKTSQDATLRRLLGLKKTHV